MFELTEKKTHTFFKSLKHALPFFCKICSCCNYTNLYSILNLGLPWISNKKTIKLPIALQYGSRIKLSQYEMLCKWFRFTKAEFNVISCNAHVRTFTSCYYDSGFCQVTPLHCTIKLGIKNTKHSSMFKKKINELVLKALRDKERY